MITAFPKIFAIGTDYIRDIFNEEVEITEKIDGSQFAFGRLNNNVYIRSKGAMLYFENHEKMFSLAISYIDSIRDRLPEGMIFYTEYLRSPKHNTLAYQRVPKNNLILFGVIDWSCLMYPDIRPYAELLDIEMVPIIYRGRIDNIVQLNDMLNRDSVLGNVKIEGIVAKNYLRRFLLGGQPMPLMAGKFVSETFKEVHRERWGTEENTKSRLEIFMESFRTPARWEKSIQHLRERGEVEDQPKDIGKLIKEIHTDIEAEEKDAIKEFLWKEYKNEILRKSTGGFPEWYKQRLAERSFE